MRFRLVGLPKSMTLKGNQSDIPAFRSPSLKLNEERRNAAQRLQFVRI